jgi:hypothetical protein
MLALPPPYLLSVTKKRQPAYSRSLLIFIRAFASFSAILAIIAHIFPLASLPFFYTKPLFFAFMNLYI